METMLVTQALNELKLLNDRIENKIYSCEFVENAMTSVGLTDMDFAGFCRDQKTRQENQIIVNEDGSESEIRNEIGEYDSDGNPVYIYGLRYEEFIAPLIATVQAQQKEIDELKKRLN